MFQRFILSVLLTAFVLTNLSACGFKDDLYIPQPTPAGDSASNQPQTVISQRV